MRRTPLCSLVAATTGAAVLLLGTGPAVAAPPADQRGSALENVSQGGGRANADTSATDGGRLSVATTARGGNALPPLAPLPIGPALASGIARVERSVAVGEGVFRVSVVLEDAVARTSRSGSAATTSTEASLTGSSGDSFTGGTPEVVGGDFAAVPGSPGDVRLSFTAAIEEPTVLFVVANLVATSRTASRSGVASAAASTSAARIVVTRVG